jgi:trehalose 6-phosphate phosphatase
MQTGTTTRHTSFGLPAPEVPDIARIALLLDVDGTLLDIATTPTGVVVPPALLPTLKCLYDHAQGSVAFVSGRTIENLDSLFAPLVLPAVGGHGAEMRLDPRGQKVRRSATVLTETLRRQVRLLAAVDKRILVEDKTYSIALHYRLALNQESFIKAKIAAITEAEPHGNIEILSGKAVIEIKSAQYSKGTAVRELMRRPPFAGRTPVFIGDDTTDESVFAILPELNGHGYSVGRTVPGVRGAFGSPDDVRAWLARICPDRSRTP